MESGSWCSKGAAACVMHSAASSARAIIVWARDLSTATLIDANRRVVLSGRELVY